MSKRILVIDDEPNIRRMIRITLETDGYEIEDAADGKTGLDTFGDGSRFDAVVLDQKMPGMDGLETLKQLRKREPAMPVVMATAFGSIELAVDAMKAGATDFLRKPLTPDTLRGAVLAAVAKRPPRQPAPADSADPPSPQMPSSDVWTVNGFFIRGLPADDARPANEHRFSVRHAGKGPHGDVTVALSDLEMSRITKLTGRQLPPGRAFWQKQAERALMNYMFREAELPPVNRLAIDRLSDDTVLAARDWKDV
jgi:CheY-like chemotaxis protein